MWTIHVLLLLDMLTIRLGCRSTLLIILPHFRSLLGGLLVVDGFRNHLTMWSRTMGNSTLRSSRIPQCSTSSSELLSRVNSGWYFTGGVAIFFLYFGRSSQCSSFLGSVTHIPTKQKELHYKVQAMGYAATCGVDDITSESTHPRAQSLSSPSTNAQGSLCHSQKNS